MSEGEAGGTAIDDGGSSTETGSSRARKPKSRAKAEVPLGAERSSARSLPAPTATDMPGQAAWLMMSSPTHKHLFLADLEWLVAPAVVLKQFRLWRRGRVPFAFASWAMLTEEAEQRQLSGQRRLGPGEWNAGDRLWLIDLVAPFGGTEGILRDLKEKAFPDREIKTLVPGPDGKGFRAVSLQAGKAEKAGGAG